MDVLMEAFWGEPPPELAFLRKAGKITLTNLLSVAEEG